MILRNINFGRVLGASGVEGFFGGDEYPYHILKRFGVLRFAGMGFVAKTMTLDPRDGNMRQDMAPDGITVRTWMPKAVHVRPRSWWNGVALNKVGLTNLGAVNLLGQNRWQQRTEPFMLSFMSLKSTVEERVEELRQFVRILKRRLREFKAPIALQINVSCPNVGVDHDHAFVEECLRMAKVARELGIPILFKIHALAPINELLEIARHPDVDGYVTSNAIEFGTPIEGVDWEALYGFKTSPLETFGVGSNRGGGSGSFLLPLVERQVRELRLAGFNKAINAGGGILCPADAIRLLEVGADSVFIGSMAFLRPWRVQPTIRAVKTYCAGY